MMERIDALKALLAKVEAGERPDDWQKGFAADVADAAADWASWAFDGSLDAAKALHEAVLGDGYVGAGFNYVVYGSGKASVWNVITGHEGRGEVLAPDLHAVSPARAWLIAVLKALLSMETEA